MVKIWKTVEDRAHSQRFQLWVCLLAPRMKNQLICCAVALKQVGERALSLQEILGGGGQRPHLVYFSCSKRMRGSSPEVQPGQVCSGSWWAGLREGVVDVCPMFAPLRTLQRPIRHFLSKLSEMHRWTSSWAETEGGVLSWGPAEGKSQFKCSVRLLVMEL